jgi:hypothetical protein
MSAVPVFDTPNIFGPYSHVVDDSDENVPDKPFEERQSEHGYADGTDPEIACDAAEASETKGEPEVEETQNFRFVFDEKALEAGEHDKVLRIADLRVERNCPSRGREPCLTPCRTGKRTAAN